MHCINCGAEIHWESDNMLSDYTGEPMPNDDDIVVGTYVCPCCNRSYEIYQPSNNNLNREPYYLGTVRIYSDIEDE